MHTAYRFAIGYFALFGLLLLFSGGWLFYKKIGFAPEAVALYYHGGTTAVGKSAYGLLETAVPHLGAMGLFIMVLSHFLLFAPKQARRYAAGIVSALFVVAALEIASGALIAAGYAGWQWIKLLAFGAMMLLLSALTLVILYYAFWHSLSPRRHPR